MRISDLLTRARAALLAAAVFSGLAIAGYGQAHAQSFPFFSNGRPFFSYAPAMNYAPSLPKIKPNAAKAADDGAEAYEEGRKAYLEGDFDLAREFWEEAANGGHLYAQWQLANMYRKGIGGVKINHEKAFKYYARVARHYRDDDFDRTRLRVAVDANVWLAHYYRTGIKNTKIKARPKRAFELYTLAATATRPGHSDAQYALGLMYVTGLGVKKNVGRGMRWYFIAAQKHHTGAMMALGDLFWTGKNVGKNKIKAMMWYVLAKNSARESEALMIQERLNNISGELDDKSRKRAELAARKWETRYPFRR